MWRESDSVDRAGLVAAVEQSADGIVITDTCGEIQYVNGAFTAMTGYTSEEAVWQNPRILNSGLQPAAFYKDLWDTISAGRVWQGELVNRRKDGSFYDEEMRIAPVTDSNGEIAGYIAIKRDVTGRRAAEKAQALLAAIVESSEDAIVACTPAGVVITWNRGAAAVFGYSADEAVGKHMSMLVPPDRQDRLARFTGPMLQGTVVSQWEGVCIHQDGHKFPVSVTGSPILDPAGRVVAISAIMSDISERREAERARASLAAIVEFSDDAIHSATLDGTIVSWNRGAERLFGYSSQEMLGMNVAMLARPDRAGMVAEHIAKIRTGCSISPFDTATQGKDGRPIDVSLSIFPVRDSAGEVVGVSSIVRDITERKRTEERLRESEERFREVFESAPAGICVVGMDGRFIQANPAFCRMLGYSAPELLATSWMELTHPDDRAPALRKREQWSKEPAACMEDELRQIRRDGTVVWVRVRVSPMRDSGGNPTSLVVHVDDITERKRTEDMLRESEERFRDVFENAPSGIYVAGPDGRIAQANAAMCRMLGYSREELAAKTWLELTHPEDVEAAVERLKRMRWEPGECIEAEKRCTHRSGAVVWVRFKLSLIRGGADGQVYSVVHMEDITEGKRAEEALRSSEDRRRMLARALESAGECISITDTEDRLLYVNQAFLRTYGYEERELIGRHIGMVRSARTPTEAQHEVLPATLAGAWEGELWNRAKDGREFPISLATSAVFDEQGKRIALVGIARDISERKQAEQALRNSQEKFRQLAENMRAVVWMVPLAAGETPYVNPAYERIWGRSCESIRQNPMSWMDAVHPDDLEQARQRFAAELEGKPGEAEFRIRTPGGQEKWIWDRAFPIRDEAGKLVRIVGISEDVTERKLRQAELIRSREAAEAANLAKSRFLANMSHEIRTPMNGVLGMIQLLLESDLNSEQQRYADVAQTSGWALLSLIDDILDLSKIEARKMSLEKLAFRPRRIIEEVVQLLRVQADAKGLAFDWRVSPEVPSLLAGDAKRLRQVLTNLCSNAIKFTERGGVTLDAVLDGVSGGAATVRFTIADTGIGIRPGQMAALFSPFVQADASTTRKYGGTGLGLAICKQLVEMMGGKIGVTSREGDGSTFWFTAVFDLSAEPVPRRLPPAAERDVCPGASGARVLVVEDNAVNRDVALAQLRKLGYLASAVSDGAEAVDAVRGGGYCLVLMDCDMPVMDGFEATRRIRGLAGPGIPIVALTADAMPADRDRCLSGGMNDYLAKPVSLDRLAEVLARWLPASGPDQPLGPRAAGAVQPPDPRAAGAAQTPDPRAAGAAQPSEPRAAGTVQPPDPRAAGTAQPSEPRPAGTAQPPDPRAAGTVQPPDPRAAGTVQPPDPRAASTVTAWFGAIARPLANARGSVRSHDREGVQSSG